MILGLPQLSSLPVCVWGISPLASETQALIYITETFPSNNLFLQYILDRCSFALG